MAIGFCTCVALLGVAMSAGCSFGTKEPKIVSGDLKKGLVIVLPGIEGSSSLNKDICKGLREGGVKYAVELYDWTVQVPVFGYVYNQRAEGRNRTKAVEIATTILHYQRAHPGKPVIVVGQSGGGAMAVWIAEAMPAGTKVDGVILLAASLSPQYMLDVALSKSDRGIVNFYSAKDWVLLGVGTTVVGTMDGSHTSSAGKVGFDVSASKAYSRLYQITWTPKMAETGFKGTHLSSGAEPFIASYIAPLVLTRKWNQDVINALLRGEDIARNDADPAPAAASARPAVAVSPAQTVAAPVSARSTKTPTNKPDFSSRQ